MKKFKTNLLTMLLTTTLMLTSGIKVIADPPKQQQPSLQNKMQTNQPENIETTEILQDEPLEIQISTKEEPEPVTLNLCDTLEQAVKNNLNILIKRDKVDETELKLEEVKNKRLFLFFKFANSSALENSARFSLESSEANLKATKNNVQAEASKKYYNVVQALLAKKVAEDFLKQGYLSLSQNTELQKLGKATRFEVMQSEVFVENLKQKLLEAEIAYMMSSLDLAQYLNKEGLNTRIIPEECSKITINNNSELNINILNVIPQNLLLSESIDYASENRPELDEIQNKIKSLEELKNATKNDEIKNETLNSQISQLEKTLKMTQNTIKTTVTQALLKLIGTRSQIDVARKKYSLSQKAYEHAMITRQEGFSTNKDIIDAQINLAQSKNDLIKSIINYNIAQIELLKELGIIEPSIIVDNTPIQIPKSKNNSNLSLDKSVKELDKINKAVYKNNPKKTIETVKQ